MGRNQIELFVVTTVDEMNRRKSDGGIRKQRDWVPLVDYGCDVEATAARYNKPEDVDKMNPFS